MASKKAAAGDSAATTEVVKVDPQLPANFDEYTHFDGAGFENTDQEDYKIPFLNLLQDGSPEVKKSSKTRIDGAEAGFFINSLTKQIYGDDGVIIVPCVTEQKVVEWIPRDDGGGGGGFAGVHDKNSPIVQQARATVGGYIGMKHPKNGNDLVLTVYIYAMVLDSVDATEPSDTVMVAIAKSKFTPYKDYMGNLRAVKGGVRFPLFCNRIRLTSEATTSKRTGDAFFNVVLAPAIEGATNEDGIVKSRIPGKLGDSTHPLLTLGHDLSKLVLAGAAKVDYSQGAEETAGDGDGGTDEVF